MLDWPTGFLAAAGVVALWWLGRRTLRGMVVRRLYNPDRGLTADPGSLGLAFTPERFLAEDGTELHGWWVPHTDAVGTILCLHGKSGNISGRLEWITEFRRLPVNVFLFDYRGYGLSRGRPTEAGLYADARAALEVVRARHGAEGDAAPPVVLYGRSLGAAVAVHLAAHEAVAGLILENGFTRLREIAERSYPAWVLESFLAERFDSLDLIEWVTAPTLVAHSAGDQLIPCRMGRELAARTSGPARFIETSGEHNESGWDNSAEYREAIRGFVEECLVVQ